MRRTSSGSIFVVAALVIIIAIFGYFGYQLYRQDKKIESIRTAVIDDGNKITSVVNFINTSIANAQQQTNK
jgi:amino acid permease